MSIDITLVVNKKKNKVAFAECDSEFVDVLFSFMTLPLGTIVRLLDKKSGLGWIDNLYESVEKLDVQYMQTAPCKTMLLQPRNVAELLCEDLTININDLEPRINFMCQNMDCVLSETPSYYSLICGVMCSCGQPMDRNMIFDKYPNFDGIFVKGVDKFIVSDDLRVSVSSVGAVVSLLQNVDDDYATAFEEKTIQVGEAEVLQLLQRSFVSRTPLSDVFLNETGATEVDTSSAVKIKSEEDHKPSIKIKQEQQEQVSNKSNGIKVKIFESESGNEAYMMESGSDFVDLLFSFLTFPLGCVMSLLQKSSTSFTLGCINNLYDCVYELGENSEDILIAQNKDMLLTPQLFPHFGCSNQILKVVEIQAYGSYITGCKTCFQTADYRDKECFHNVPNKLITEINPKMKEATSENGGVFARTSMKFLITPDELAVKPASAFTTVQLLKERGASFNNLRERVVTIGETEALNLLKACLSSADRHNQHKLFVTRERESELLKFSSWNISIYTRTKMLIILTLLVIVGTYLYKLKVSDQLLQKKMMNVASFSYLKLGSQFLK